MEQSAIERLQAKSPEEAIIEQITRDFNLAPFMAKTQFQQMQQYFGRYLGLERDVGQMTFLAVSADTPPGQPMARCKRVPICLTLDCPDDLEALRQGVATLRRSKIQRLTREAQEQGALLTQEDLARLLCVGRSTINRDISSYACSRIVESSFSLTRNCANNSEPVGLSTVLISPAGALKPTSKAVS